ncbi:unnamed protein product, partial [Amoebophrya sp. A120]
TVDDEAALEGPPSSPGGEILRSLQSTSLDAGNTTADGTVTGCTQSCCANVRKAVEVLASEFSDLGVDAEAQKEWARLAEDQCPLLNCDCEEMSAYVETRCNFHVGAEVMSVDEARKYC